MPKTRLTRGKLLAAAAPLAAIPIAGRFALDDNATAGGHDHSSHAPQRSLATHERGAMGHAAMIGAEVPAVGGPNDLDALLYPPPALPYKPGRVREYDLTATDYSPLQIRNGIHARLLARHYHNKEPWV